jgi:hypothetical protein
MQNITQYSDQELSLYFMNDEGLYNMAQSCNSSNELQEIADQCFIYTPDQLSELEDDFSNGAFS